MADFSAFDGKLFLTAKRTQANLNDAKLNDAKLNGGLVQRA